MARVRFTPGTGYLLRGRVYLVRGVLAQDQVLVEDRSFGGETAVAREGLLAAWDRGELRFELQDSRQRAGPREPPTTGHAIADLGGLPEKQRDEAWRRYRLILPLLKLPECKRTRRATEAYAATLRPVPSEPGSGRRTRSAVGSAVSRTSLDRWLHRPSHIIPGPPQIW